MDRRDLPTPMPSPPPRPGPAILLPPKHGSWLNMAEAELSVLARQCLARRIPNIATLDEQVAAWMGQRNKHHVKADWRFKTEDARIKLKNLYPVL